MLLFGEMCLLQERIILPDFDTKQVDVIEASNSASGFLDDLLNFNH